MSPEKKAAIAIKAEPKKVASTVATFLNKGSDGFQILATKAEPKKGCLKSIYTQILFGKYPTLTLPNSGEGTKKSLSPLLGRGI